MLVAVFANATSTPEPAADPPVPLREPDPPLEPEPLEQPDPESLPDADPADPPNSL
jgi:hypothetical protein